MEINQDAGIAMIKLDALREEHRSITMGIRLRHGSLYKIHVHGRNGWLDRIPAYATRVVQDERTKDFTAQFWIPRPFDWSDDTFDIARHDELLIYEAHVGMAQERPGVGTYREFADRILPVIARDGYNTVQLMGHRQEVPAC